jgi:hypothetical protein
VRLFSSRAVSKYLTLIDSKKDPLSVVSTSPSGAQREYKSSGQALRVHLCLFPVSNRLYLDPPLEPASFFSMGLFKRGKVDAVDASHSAKANTYNFYVVFFSALGSFTYGYNSSIIGSVFGLPAFWTYFDLSLTGSKAKEGNDIIGGKRRQVSLGIIADV